MAGWRGAVLEPGGFWFQKTPALVESGTGTLTTIPVHQHFYFINLYVLPWILWRSTLKGPSSSEQENYFFSKNIEFTAVDQLPAL